MLPSSALITDIEDAVFDRMLTAMSPGGTYEEPAYLQLKTTLRAAGQPKPQVAEAALPALWVEYIAGAATRENIGTRIPFADETFTLFAELMFTPEILGLSSRDEQEFALYALRSADTFMRRILTLTRGWSPGVTCPVTGQKATRAWADLWSTTPTRITALKLEYIVIVRLIVRTEP